MAMAQVQSANTVGYQQYSLNAGQFYMIGVQFGTVGTGEGIPMSDLVVGSIPYESEIQVLNTAGTGYDIYTYREMAVDPQAQSGIGSGWSDGSWTVVRTPVPAGTCFWLTVPSSATANISGQVLASSAPQTATGGQFKMVANPFPVALNPTDDMVWTGLSYGDEIQVLNAAGTGYDIYTYREMALDPDAPGGIGSGWSDGTWTAVHTGIVPVGQGFWLNPAQNVTMTFNAPF